MKLSSDALSFVSAVLFCPPHGFKHTVSEVPDFVELANFCAKLLMLHR